MCGSLLSKFKKTSNKIAPVLNVEYMDPQWFPRKKCLSNVASMPLNGNLSREDLSLERKFSQRIRFSDLGNFIERNSKMNMAEENTAVSASSVFTSDEANTAEPAFEVDATDEVLSVSSGIQMSTEKRSDTTSLQAFDGSQIKRADSAGEKEKKTASQRQLVITTSTLNQASPDSVLGYEDVEPEILGSSTVSFDYAITVQSEETVLEVQNKQALVPLDDHQERLRPAHHDRETQESFITFEGLSPDVLEKVSAKENVMLNRNEKGNLELVCESLAEKESKFEVPPVEVFDEIKEEQTQEKMMTPSESIPKISPLQGQAETRVKSASSQELALAEKREARMIGSIEDRPSSVTLKRAPVCAERVAASRQASITVATEEQQNDRLVVEADSFSRSKVNLENELQNPNDVQMDRNVLLSMAKKQLEIKVLSMTAGSSVKTRELLLAVATKELENRIFQMFTAEGGLTSAGTNRIAEFKATCMENQQQLNVNAKEKLIGKFKKKLGAFQSGLSSSNTVRSLELGKTKNTIAFEVLNGNKRKETVIPWARLPLSLRRLDEPPPLTSETITAKLLRAERNRTRKLQEVQSRARNMSTLRSK